MVRIFPVEILYNPYQGLKRLFLLRANHQKLSKSSIIPIRD
ncbi:hypothetical protein MC7420_8296 [Coleofasciculus chthonoplastes PCC 7420]|uniref:Uncharacterized protein n=1 Tax=Coleofasciculus chthonoplastes PCC 7420 TaxID=118168 RepID=B4W0N7_9CYAN|nr:hypothetical protein MC7420_8296 [Coleofasciculus chthonoplastes PCC 7420]